VSRHKKNLFVVKEGLQNLLRSVALGVWLGCKVDFAAQRPGLWAKKPFAADRCKEGCATHQGFLQTFLNLSGSGRPVFQARADKLKPAGTALTDANAP
jgi:hypothetical protein